MELQSSRLAARVAEDGSPILLLDQDRSQWDPVHIVRGFAALDRATRWPPSLVRTRSRPRLLHVTLALTPLKVLIGYALPDLRAACSTDWLAGGGGEPRGGSRYGVRSRG